VKRTGRTISAKSMSSLRRQFAVDTAMLCKAMQKEYEESANPPPTLSDEKSFKLRVLRVIHSNWQRCRSLPAFAPADKYAVRHIAQDERRVPMVNVVA